MKRNCAFLVLLTLSVLLWGCNSQKKASNLNESQNREEKITKLKDSEGKEVVVKESEKKNRIEIQTEEGNVKIEQTGNPKEKGELRIEGPEGQKVYVKRDKNKMEMKVGGRTIKLDIDAKE